VAHRGVNPGCRAAALGSQVREGLTRHPRPAIISNLTDHFGVTGGLVARAGVHGGFLVREPAATDNDRVELEEVSADELLTAVIPITRRGYSPDVIDSLLERAAATIERLRPLDAPALERERRERADLLQRTLMLAQARADETVTQAQTVAGEIRDDAEAGAQLLIADAEQLAAHLVETERLRAHAILEDALACRDVVQDDVAALEEFASQARARLRDALEAELTGLDGLLGAFTSRPGLHEIDLTDPTLGSGHGAGQLEAPRDTAPHEMTWVAPELGVPGTDEPIIALMVQDRDAES
jgi:cell division septum initiation protein DivIVA